ncbi:hypothetical protein QTP70_012194 [Hemibagrus guttatus]|uniref:Uncharacterized protein n=1 Tax=Hemibagrus guttatus TaxID=175788 RepID=A0AAE0RGC0_9TELE|nr:hypothetical protein QTP70_012194 [Hemibagrus guttatus]
MPEPPQLAPFDVEEQRLYSELLLGGRAPYPISKGAPRHPTEEAHFGRLYPGSYPFGHDPELMTIDRYIDRITANPSVNLTIHPSLTRKQDPEILKLLHLRKELPSLNRHIIVVEGFEYLNELRSHVVGGLVLLVGSPKANGFKFQRRPYSGACLRPCQLSMAALSLSTSLQTFFYNLQ